MEDLCHAVPGESGGAAGPCPQGVDMSGDGGTAVPLRVQGEHHAHEPGLRLPDLQGGAAACHGLPVAVGGVGHIAPVLDGAPEPPAQPLVDDLVLPAAHEGLELRKLVVDLVGEVVDLLRGDDQRAAVPEGVQDDALVLHPPAGEAVQVHAEHRAEAPRLHVRQQTEHLGPGVEALAADHLGIPVHDGEAVALGALLQALPVAAQDLAGVQALLHPGFSQVASGPQAGEGWFWCHE